MAKKQNEALKRIITVRMKQADYDLLEKKWKSSTCRKLSDFIRRVVFERPVVATYRNRSLDELMNEAMVLRKELNAIGNNFNQAVHRLHTLDHLPQMERWLIGFERDKSTLFGKIDEIVLQVEKMAATWLQ